METCSRVLSMVLMLTLCLTAITNFSAVFYVSASHSTPDFVLEEKVLYENDGSNNFWWSHLRCAAIPRPLEPEPKLLCTVSLDPKETPNLSDVFYDIAYAVSTDGGDTWSPLVRIPQYQWKTLPDGYDGMLIDPVPVYHPQSGKIILFGMAQSYNLASSNYKKHNYPAYAVYDPATDTWSADWYLMDWPGVYGHTGSVYPYILDDSSGTILWPINPLDGSGTLKVMQVGFDGSTLTYLGEGTAVGKTGGNGNRSGIEPSLTRWNGEFFMTMRDDLQNRLAKSADGLHWEDAVPLQWDDGTLVEGSMNTQMHWINRPDALYLVYTRKDSSNSDIFRYRAPLWMAKVDPVTLRLQKESERIVMGITSDRAQLGNFGTYDVSPSLSIVSSNEWNSLVPNRAIVSLLHWDRKLLGHWPFDEAAGSIVYDRSSGGHDGMIVQASRSSAGKFGSALELGGNGHYADLGNPDSGDFNFGTDKDFTLSAWVKTSKTGKVQFVLNKGDTNASYWLRFEADGTLRFLLDYGSTYDDVRSTAAYNDGKWHHVAGTVKRGAGMALYVDGVKVAANGQLSGGSVSSQLPLTVGVPGANSLTGLVDEVKLYNYPLGEQEIQQLYGLMASWSMEEPSGDILYDATVHRINGTFAGASRITDGAIGNGLAFDGITGKAAFPASGTTALNFGTSQSFSLSLWARTGRGGVPQYIINKGDTNASFWLRYEADGKIRFLLDYGPTYDDVRSTSSWNDGQWHHIAAVVDREKSLSLYVDGVLQGQKATLLGGNVSSPLPLLLGSVGTTGYLQGAVDEVRIFNYPLSAADVADLAAEG
ncbi:sialidase family protein [Paenibacillus sp. GCM10027626]|uniref:sialidase family protein n=1 Tax=Paenibacillus sp. GCM10027626 TaxID=3273411 RepID=UPI0036331DA8